MTFIYNEETRIHTLNGKVIPSVSQVIAPLSDFSMVSASVLARKTELGNQFHEACHLHIIDDLLFDSLDPDLVKPMNTFINWWSGFSDNYDNSNIVPETPGYHKTLKYCGKPDLEIQDEHFPALFDWKLRGYLPVVDTLKLEAYNHMLSRKNYDLWTVCFDLEGGFRMHCSRNKYAWGIYRKLLERYNSELEFHETMNKWKGMN